VSLPIRISEWSRVPLHDLTEDMRGEIERAAEGWRQQNGLPATPLSFSGHEGNQLCTRQYVGVVEVNDVVIEIYPKLDATLIDAGEGERLPPSAKIDSVMRNLLWILEVADYRDLAEAQTAHLEEVPTSFFDLFAFVLGKNLLPELERGVPHTYLTFEDDLKTVRGRIGLIQQVTLNWNRFDRVRCSWDEFTADTAINRLFKCACRFLSQRVNYSEAARLLLNCEALLAEVDDVSAVTALRDVANLRFDRSIERFRTAFDLARRLLAGIGHDLGAGSAKTFVFLLDMNRLFERYVHAVLESHFVGVAVEEQTPVGDLLRIQPGGIRQVADYLWRDSSTYWIGDAKYKHLAKGHSHALRFSELEGQSENPDDLPPLAGRILDAGDIRQLTVYAELVRLRGQLAKAPELMLLYPFVGSAIECLPDSVTAWNGSRFWLMPVLVKAQTFVGDAIRFPALPGALAGAD
jgi:5-methylcytosine-specific restriction endonuclease McrBC regulatory subunit McrC